MTHICPAVTAAFTAIAGNGVTMKIKLLLGDAAALAVSGHKLAF